MVNAFLPSPDAIVPAIDHPDARPLFDEPPDTIYAAPIRSRRGETAWRSLNISIGAMIYAREQCQKVTDRVKQMLGVGVAGFGHVSARTPSQDFAGLRRGRINRPRKLSKLKLLRKSPENLHTAFYVNFPGEQILPRAKATFPQISAVGFPSAFNKIAYLCRGRNSHSSGNKSQLTRLDKKSGP